MPRQEVAIKIQYGTAGLKFRVLQDRTAGVCDIIADINVTIEGFNSAETVKMKLSLLSLWVNPHTNFAIKAHLRVEPADLQQRSLADRLWSAGVAISGDFALTVTPDRRIIRYGWNHQRVGVSPAWYDTATAKFHYFYDSKALAIRDILASVKDVCAMGGLEQSSFNVVPDDILEDIGFLKIEDVLGRGVPMWMGTPVDVMNAGAAGFSYGRSQQVEDNAKGFFHLLSESLS